MKRFKKIWVNLLVAVIAFLIPLLMFEILLRIQASIKPAVTLDELEARRKEFRGREANLGYMVMATKDPRLVYRLIPNLSLKFSGEKVSINGAGYRDDVFQLDKKEGVLRIAVLGDSGSFGWKVAKEDSYPEILESTINQYLGRKQVEVYNFSVPGYNTVMEREVLVQDALKYQPDAVVLQFDGNDYDLPNFMMTPESPLALDKCFTLDFILIRMQAIEKKYDMNLMAGLEHVPLQKGSDGQQHFAYDAGRVPKQYAALDGMENNLAALREIGDICREKKLQPVFLVNPNFYSDVNTSISSLEKPAIETAEKAGFKIANPVPRLAAFLRKHNLNSQDLWVDALRIDSHARPPRHALQAAEIFSQLYAAGFFGSLISAQQAAELEHLFAQRAEDELLHSERPQLLSEIFNNNMQTVPIGDLKFEKDWLGDGWYPPEANEWGQTFRWTQTEARLHLPEKSIRIWIQVGSDWPKEINPADQRLMIGDRAIPYTLRPGDNTNWLIADLPPDVKPEEENRLTLQIHAIPVNIPGTKMERQLGLMVYTVAVETNP